MDETPEQIAERLIDDIPYRWTGTHDCGDVPDIQAFFPLLVAALRSVAQAQRERDAQMVEDWGAGEAGGISAAAFDARYGCHASLAAAIRAQS